MNAKTFGFATLLSVVVSPAFAAPVLSVSPGGIQSGNWVWDVSITPDLLLAGGETPLAVELGFRLIGDPLLSATNINPSEFDTPNPGRVIFGWEALTDLGGSGDCGSGMPGHCPVGLQVNTSTGEIFAAFGSIDFTTPDPKPFLKIIASGPGSGGPSSSTIQWLGAYALGNGRIAQIVGGITSANFDIYSGTATQAVPEPVGFALILIGLAVASCKARRQRSLA